MLSHLKKVFLLFGGMIEVKLNLYFRDNNYSTLLLVRSNLPPGQLWWSQASDQEGQEPLKREGINCFILHNTILSLCIPFQPHPSTNILSLRLSMIHRYQHPDIRHYHHQLHHNDPHHYPNHHHPYSSFDFATFKLFSLLLVLFSFCREDFYKCLRFRGKKQS